MNSSDEKKVKELLARYIADGITLSEAQNLINAELKLGLTYMDIRIIASTLEIDWKKDDPHPAKEEEPQADDVAETDDAVSGEESAGNGTVVEISKLVRPGFMLSGTVKFASGSTADWYIDNANRLGLENLVGEKPTQEDIQLFQMELQRAITGGR